MLTLAEKYPYLFCSLLLAALGTLGVAVSPRRLRWHTVLSGLLSVPFAFASVLFVPQYWNPVRVLSAPVGVEDLLFSLSTGAIAWLIATGFVRDRMAVPPSPNRRIRRYVLGAFAGLAVGWICEALGMAVMSSAVVSIIFLGLGLLALRPGLWPLFVVGGIGFAVLYLVVMKAVFALTPEFVRQWSAGNLWGLFLAGIPLEELVWAAVFGAVWPVFAAYVFGAQLLPAGAQPPGPFGRSLSHTA